MIVGDRNSPAPSAAMEVADEEEEEEEGDQARVNVVEDENKNETEVVKVENAEEEVDVAHERFEIKRARISADESRESKIMPTLGALRSQRRKGTPVKALPK